MRRRLLCILCACALWAACDSIEPVEDSRLVVEGYLDTDDVLPQIRISRTLSPAESYDAMRAAVANADVDVVVNGRRVAYRPVPGSAGIYRPDVEVRTQAGDVFVFRVEWQGIDAEASGVVPPRIGIDHVTLSVPEAPVSAVLLDSLALTDSLSVGAQTGYIYPIEVTVTWKDAPDFPDDLWVRANLSPRTTFSSTVVDLFLRSEQIARERTMSLTGDGRRSWTGVYAVGVSREDDPLPPHDLRVALVRSGEDYARFAATRDDPARREPISNLRGAAGIFAALSVDSVRVFVSPTPADSD